jgi:hypothetical protein
VLAAGGMDRTRGRVAPQSLAVGQGRTNQVLLPLTCPPHPNHQHSPEIRSLDTITYTPQITKVLKHHSSGLG